MVRPIWTRGPNEILTDPSSESVKLMINVAEASAGIRGPGGQTDRLWLAAQTESALAEAGWFESSVPPYPEPTTEVDAPPRQCPPVIKAVRRIWLAKFNPAAPQSFSDARETSGSDVDEGHLSHWSPPEIALQDGNFWLATTATPKNRVGIEALNVGDRV